MYTHAAPAVMVKVRDKTWEVVKPGVVHAVANGQAAQKIVEIELR